MPVTADEKTAREIAGSEEDVSDIFLTYKLLSQDVLVYVNIFSNVYKRNNKLVKVSL